MSASSFLEAGAVIGKDFRVLRPLSSGGMGAVYVAQQISTGRERALKLMLGEIANDPDLRRRFEQEAKVGGIIESDHVVEVVAAGIDDALGCPWLAMELLSGEDLAHRLRRGTLDSAEVLALFRSITHAVAAAHDKRIVHRDLKPENIFIAAARRAEGVPTVKVLDFGIAKLLSHARTSSTAAIGTPLWMAPEQMQSGAGVSEAADVWALGLIAFRALTGKIYWMSAADPSPSAMMLVREIAMDPIEAASARARRLGGAALPPGFDAWFSQCVAREPRARFQHARQTFAALEQALSPRSTSTDGRPSVPAVAPPPADGRIALVARAAPPPTTGPVPVAAAPSVRPAPPPGAPAPVLDASPDDDVAPTPTTPRKLRNALIAAAAALVLGIVLLLTLRRGGPSISDISRASAKRFEWIVSVPESTSRPSNELHVAALLQPNFEARGVSGNRSTFVLGAPVSGKLVVSVAPYDAISTLDRLECGSAPSIDFQRAAATICMEGDGASVVCTLSLDMGLRGKEEAQTFRDWLRRMCETVSAR